MQVRFVNFNREYDKYKGEIDEAIHSCLSRGKLILQEEVEVFEQEFAQYLGVKHVVGLNSGTDALYLALSAKGIGEGDEVLVPDHTFVATAQVVQQLGAVPVLYGRDMTIIPNDRTKAIIPVHIAGEMQTDMSLAMEIADGKDLVLLEDACQALGAQQKGRMAGTWGHAGAFSFYPAKILGGIGDGGALVTDDDELAAKVRSLRNHCKDNPDNWGVNSRLDNVNAAVLSVRLKHIQEILETRKAIAEFYLEALSAGVRSASGGKDLPLILPENKQGRVWQDFIIECENAEKRENLIAFLAKQGIETMRNEYPMPIPKTPETGEFERRSLRIPCNDVLYIQEANYVAEKIKEFYGSNS